jgi:abequosyltransferase
MQPDRPLLTIAIPTYNRQQYLTELLSVLEPQLAAHPEVELLISDNASSDATAEAVDQFVARGMKIRYHRHPENIGPDRNFIFCLNSAQGKYFWLCGDDDIIVPGALDKVTGHLSREEFDLVYLTSYSFNNNFAEEKQADPLGRRFHRIASERQFSKTVNIMFTFVSGIIVNKDRLNDIQHEDPAAFIDSYLIQLSWTLPLLRNHRRSLILWDRPIAGRHGNAGGYAIGKVFGKTLVDVTRRCLPDRPDLAANIVNFTVRRWIPSMIYAHRRDGNEKLSMDSARTAFQQAYGRNFRFWLFAYPVLTLPLPLAGLWLKAGAVVSRAIYTVTMPGFWQKEI